MRAGILIVARRKVTIVNMSATKTNTKHGFTIVELLIVIVVIAILAAISIVAYNGIQSRARDTLRKTDLANISKALKLYSVDKDNWIGIGSGCGYGGDGWGWFNRGPDAVYPQSINNCLKLSGYIKNDIIDPTKSTSSGFAYMKADCIIGGSERVYLFANLETMPQSSTATDGTCGGGYDTSYGMNYYLQVK